MGDRTDKAITSILSGYPAQPTESIIKHPKKTATLSFLSKDFEKMVILRNFIMVEILNLLTLNLIYLMAILEKS